MDIDTALDAFYHSKHKERVNKVYETYSKTRIPTRTCPDPLYDLSAEVIEINE